MQYVLAITTPTADGLTEGHGSVELTACYSTNQFTRPDHLIMMDAIFAVYMRYWII